MKKILSILLLVLFSLTTFASPYPAFAQGSTPTLPPATNVNVVPQPGPQGQWVIDPEVTFIGKNAARSGKLLDWMLRNYNWVCIKRVTDTKDFEAYQCDNNSNNPIQKYWLLIMTTIVVPLLFAVLLGSAAVIIITRGRGLSVMRFIPRFIAVIVLIVFSYSMVQFFFQFTDLIQGFFFRTNANNPCPPDCISQKDLLFVGWNYEQFVGLRLIGDYFAESAFVSLLLTKLTALTYFVMVFILIIRKVILWFFIIVSPVFPILLMYYPTRNTGKIWVGEFFRWLMYAPLFAIFLRGLVEMWRAGIPLQFAREADVGKSDKIIYPTAVNILLGGPKQFVTPTNSVNLTETFALYVVALIMLWTVILLPWVLLQIFLEYASNFNADNSAVMKTMVNMLTKQPVAPAAPQTPIAPIGSGSAVNLPFSKKFSIPKSLQSLQTPPNMPGGAAKELPIPGKQESPFEKKIKEPTLVSPAATALSMSGATAAQMQSQTMNPVAPVLSLANLKVPSIRDIAKFESKLLSRDNNQKQEATNTLATLAKIANPASATSTTERERFEKIREKLVEQKDQGNIVAAAVLNASSQASSVMERRTAFTSASNEQVKSILSQIANPASITNVVSREKMTSLNSMLTKESSTSQLASTILSVSDKTSTSNIEKIKEQIVQASQRTDTVASSVLSTITNSSQRSNQDIKSVLQQIANPQSASTVDRQSFTKINEMLKKESTQNHNSLATSILSVTNKTSNTEIEKIKESLSQAKDSEIARSVVETFNSTATPQSVTAQRTSFINTSTQQVKNVLQQISNPQSASTNRETFTKVHEMLTKESSSSQLASTILSVSDKTSVSDVQKVKEQIVQASQRTDTVASSVLSTISHSSQSMNTDTKTVLQQIANPQLASSVDREAFTKVHEVLTKESKENNNSLATSILSVTDKTSVTEVEKIKESLSQAKDSEIARSVISTMNTVAAPESTQATTIKSVLQGLANPQSTATNNTKFAELHKSLESASKGGNELATALLSVSDKTSVTEIEALEKKLVDAKQQGVPFASQITDLAKPSAIPVVNQVQKVSQEELNEVRTMWKQNYSTQDVPQGIVGTRSEWIKDDVTKIDQTITMLSSKDQDQVSQGMNNIADVMPFLLAGGFSQTEIVSYLSAKKAAATDVLQEINKEEEQKVSVGTKTTHAAQTMAASLPETQKGTVRTTVNVSAGSSEEPEEESVLSNLSSLGAVSQPQVSKETSVGSLSAGVLTLSDLAGFDAKRQTEVDKVHAVFAKIANPAVIQDETERQQFQAVREKLVQQSEQGNIMASAVLGASENYSKALFSKIANPSSITAEADKKRFEELHGKLSQASQQGDKLASAILSAKDVSSPEEIDDLTRKLQQAHAKGEPLAQSVVASIAGTVNLPNKPEQQVSQQDIQNVKNTWLDNYRTMETPKEVAGTRRDWLKDEFKAADEAIGLLNSGDQEKVKKGLGEVYDILPFLLAGGFSQTEIVSYLSAKKAAASDVLQEINKEEEQKISVGTKATHAAQTMAASLPETQKSASGTTVNVSAGSSEEPEEESVLSNLSTLGAVSQPQASQEASTGVLTLSDLAGLDAKRKTEIDKVHAVFAKIANPATIQDETERQQFQAVREKLVQQSEQGNILASAVLGASENYSKSLFSKIANPSTVTSEVDKKRYEELHSKLSQASQQGDKLASAILSAKDVSSPEEIDDLTRRLQQAHAKGEPLAQSVVASIAETVNLPNKPAQQINQQDVQNVKNTWLENYRTMETPKEVAGTRRDWLKDEFKAADEAIGLLNSGDQEKVKKGLGKVYGILPFLLMGNFSLAEITSYLKAKSDAAKQVLGELEKEEQTKVGVEKKEQKNDQTMAVNLDEEKKKEGELKDVLAEQDAAEDKAKEQK